MKRQEKKLLKREREVAERQAEIARAEKYMKLALKEAAKAEAKGEVPIGAVIVRGDEVIAKAHNLRETKKIATAHAEVLAIEKACKKAGDWRLDGMEMFVSLEPCAMCAGAIANARIKKLYFGAYEKKGGACSSVHNVLNNSGLNHNCSAQGGILENVCSETLRAFFENKRKKYE